MMSQEGRNVGATSSSSSNAHLASMTMTTSMTTTMHGHYRREVAGNFLEQFGEERTRNHWRRNKKASIDLQELPVAVDRQLEDQRLLMERNRNPQLDVPTKVDRVRSEQIIAKVGASRAVAVKAKMLNKIVREASGMNAYVITAPPRSELEKVEPEVDADTNPHFKAYARETKKNPVIVSFGHRPRSASRTFNPATMRFRMRHGEMIRAPGAGKYGFGMPVGILAKILKAPKIEQFGANFATEGGVDDGTSLPSARSLDPHDLFSLPDPEPGPEQNDSSPMNYDGDARDYSLRDDSVGMESWISPTQQSMELQQLRRARNDKDGVSGHQRRRRSRQGNSKQQLAALTIDTSAARGTVAHSIDDRPQWDEAHHNVRYSPKEIYKIKANIMPNQPYTLQERMTRFTEKTIADELTPFCREKQTLDLQLLRSDKPHTVAVISPPKGQQRFFDPLNTNLEYVKQRREEMDKKESRKWKARGFQDALMTIPKVAYHPQTLSKQLQAGQVKLSDIIPLAQREARDWEDFQPPPVIIPRAGTESKTKSASAVALLPNHHDSMTSTVDAGSGILSDSEIALIDAMKKAKYGNKRALFNLFLSSGGSSTESKTQQIEEWVKESEEWPQQESEQQESEQQESEQQEAQEEQEPQREQLPVPEPQQEPELEGAETEVVVAVVNETKALEETGLEKEEGEEGKPEGPHLEPPPSQE